MKITLENLYDHIHISRADEDLLQNLLGVGRRDEPILQLMADYIINSEADQDDDY